MIFCMEINIIVFFAESDLFIGLVTFVACLVLPLEIGILLGVGINMISILHSAARPNVSLENLKVSGEFLGFIYD